MNVLDVWEPAEAFQAFNDQRLGPAVQEIGIEGEPDVRFYPMHACFAPALGGAEMVRNLGRVHVLAGREAAVGMMKG